MYSSEEDDYPGDENIIKEERERERENMIS